MIRSAASSTESISRIRIMPAPPSQTSDSAAGSFIRTALRTGLPFGLIMTVVFWFTSRSAVQAFSSGMLGGLIFGVLLAWFVGNQTAKFKQKHPDFSGETLLFEGPANHFVGAEGVVGYLWLTERRLFFRSHRFNFQNHELTISLADISRVKVLKMLGFIPKGLAITVHSGATERLVVNDHKRWQNLTAALMQSAA